MVLGRAATVAYQLCTLQVAEGVLCKDLAALSDGWPCGQDNVYRGRLISLSVGDLRPGRDDDGQQCK